ncbi:DUF1569 domain-containing protein [Aporhodopirellula aestuarii]|uniref:DUF1569 domain-containing protein n=1 Tax=Aporhodopirellula aestuarii TaxID=2950107 RepID=A0ABT0U5H8_9BACT|nr:DUF1569 domain-containing protein [Aporhodopirellula aestuarii]MCM2372181.1 DUF1569 domain-containing protein [Aporhodopirellula aestuarii]
MNHRELHFKTLDEGMAEVERLATCETTTAGSFSFGQILDHLARTIRMAVGDAPPPKVPLLLKIFGPMIRGKILNGRPKPGFKLPPKMQEYFWSKEDVPVETALAELRAAHQRFASMTEVPRNPMFGNLTYTQTEQLQCRHFELHLGFVHEA